MALNHTEKQQVAGVRLAAAEKCAPGVHESVLPVKELIGEIVRIALKTRWREKSQTQKEIEGDETADELMDEAAYGGRMGIADPACGRKEAPGMAHSPSDAEPSFTDRRHLFPRRLVKPYRL